MCPAWHGIPAKAFQVSLPAVHLPRNPCESVPGVPSRLPPATEIPQKCVRCPFPPSTWHGFPAKAFQVSLPALHLPRKSRESVSGSTSCLPPGTVSLRKCSRCPIPPSTCHGNPAKVCQVSFSAFHLARFPRESVPGVTSCPPPATEIPRKCVRWHLPASYLPRNPCKSVPGVLSCRPPATEFPRKCVRWHLPASYLPRFSYESVPGVSSRRPPATEFPQKRSRCHLLPPTCYGFPAKACQVSFPCCPPGTEIPQKRSRWHVPPSTWHGIPAKVFQVSLPAVHLPRNSRKSVPGVTFCLPPATVSPQKCVRCHLLPSTWHGIPAKVFQVSLPAVHLARNPRKSVPGVSFRLPSGTESLRKRSR